MPSGVAAKGEGVVKGAIQQYTGYPLIKYGTEKAAVTVTVSQHQQHLKHMLLMHICTSVHGESTNSTIISFNNGKLVSMQ